ncbi:hypothetical protein BDZ91DRAFT_771307 [Kalaharituber pfeilii]|nr:hypothetical protein BDZ91DRAFT_771307 [Kalaharituber pfeilii]
MSSPSPSYFSSPSRSFTPSSPISIPPSQQFRLRALLSTCGTTSNIQANLLVLPSRYAEDFKAFCVRNPVPCSLLDITSPGEYSSRLAAYTDLRTDIPAYNVYIDGVLDESGKDNVKTEWSSDHIGFLLGCSYSFETALARQGLAPRHMLLRKSVPMFISNIPLNPAGVFSKGTYVVSMRWYKPSDIPKVQDITRRYARQHGEPIAWGWDGAEKIGVLDRIRSKTVDFGEWTDGEEDEIPVFWGSGVTSQLIVMECGIEGVVLSHMPGCMFVTDIPDEEALMRMLPTSGIFFS